MMEAQRRIAVAGATGRVGRHAVEALESRGHEVVAISRSGGIDLVTGEGLAEALVGVEAVIDAATGPSPEEAAATEFFLSVSRNLQEHGERAGVQRIVVVSIIGIDRFGGGYGAAKVAHEQAMLAGPVPARILRATQFHEFVGQLVDWGRQGEVSYVPNARMQPVAARAVAEALADLALDAGAALRAGLDPGDRRPARGEPRRPGEAPYGPSRRPGADRGRERSVRPDERRVRVGRAASWSERSSRRPDLRGMARLRVRPVALPGARGGGPAMIGTEKAEQLRAPSPGLATRLGLAIGAAERWLHVWTNVQRFVRAR